MSPLLHRYLQTFRHAWGQRQALAGPELTALEAEFLPAALALRDAPAPAAPRVLMAVISLFAVLTLLWSIFGAIDIVATAHGKIVPNDYTKVIQPSETAVVKTIHVRDGQAVRAGDPLIDLDATQSQADAERLARELGTARLQAARAQALWQAVKAGQPPPALDRPEGVSAAMALDEERLLAGQYAEYRSKLSAVEAELDRHRAESETVRQTITKLEQTAPLAEQRARDFRNLSDKNFVSRHAWLEKEQQSIEQRQDLGAAKSKHGEIQASLVETQRRRETLMAETLRIALDAQSEAELKAASLSQELVKAQQKSRLMRLTAPVDGVVQQLAVHTVGGVVTPAQPLLSVVPQGHALEIEAWLENKDIGFVQDGQPAEVKVETFLYTKYGTIPGVVEHVSRDAVQDEKLGLVYLAQVRLARSTIDIEGRQVNLSPGMAVSVEIKTGKRRVIEYFLSPLMQMGQESLGER